MLRGRTPELSCLENAPSELHTTQKNGRRFQGQLEWLVRPCFFFGFGFVFCYCRVLAYLAFFRFLISSVFTSRLSSVVRLSFVVSLAQLVSSFSLLLSLPSTPGRGWGWGFLGLCLSADGNLCFSLCLLSFLFFLLLILGTYAFASSVCWSFLHCLFND